ncbi:MAG: pentapeptide repeat-containing protein [Deltaproteobacteria bacterium]|nr:pentapeptide repeat-containing protein [Deltaproteobacteria bacterium]
MLKGTDLFGERLDGSPLRRAVLDGADISYASLVAADLREASLVSSSLVGSNLSLVRLGGANLRDARLSEATLDAAFLEGADLSGASLDEVQGHEVRARGAIMTSADVHDAYLAGADLRNADLSQANLTSSDLGGADLRGAWLEGARLDGAFLCGADLNGAKVTAAQLQKAYVNNAAGLPPDMQGSMTLPARYGPGGPVPAFDRGRLLSFIDDLAALTGQVRRGHVASVLDHFERELALLAEVQMPFSGTAMEPAAMELGLITGGRGKVMHEKLVREMQRFGIPKDRRELIAHIGQVSGYWPVGFKVAVTGKLSEFQVYFRGPLGMAEVGHHLREVGLSAAANLFDSGAEAMDKRHVHFLAFECSPDRPLASEAYWTQLFGDREAPARLAQVVGMAWDPPQSLLVLLAQSHWPTYLSLTEQRGEAVPGIKLDLHILSEDARHVAPLLASDDSRKLFYNIERRLNAGSAEMEHISVRLFKDGRIKVATYLRPSSESYAASKRISPCI